MKDGVVAASGTIEIPGIEETVLGAEILGPELLLNNKWTRVNNIWNCPVYVPWELSASVIRYWRSWEP